MWNNIGQRAKYAHPYGLVLLYDLNFSTRLANFGTLNAQNQTYACPEKTSILVGLGSYLGRLF